MSSISILNSKKYFQVQRQQRNLAQITWIATELGQGPKLCGFQSEVLYIILRVSYLGNIWQVFKNNIMSLNII